MSKTALFLSLLIWSASSAAGAHVYQASLSQSDWRSSQDDHYCYLAHGIPYFGVALFAGDADNELKMTLYTRRPPAVGGKAQVISRAPAWESHSSRTLGTTRIWPGAATFRFNHHMTNIFLEQLEAGRLPTLRFNDWHDDGRTVSVALSQAGFKPAYDQFLKCMANRTRKPESGSSLPENLLSRMGYGPALQETATPRRGSATQTGKNSDKTAPAQQSQAVQRVYFSFDSAGLDRDSEQQLRKLAKQLRQDQTVAVVLAIGHTDDVGSDSYNRALSRRRADAVRAYLADHGVNAKRIRVSGAGESAPAAPNDNEFDRSENRRVEIRLGANS